MYSTLHPPHCCTVHPPAHLPQVTRLKEALEAQQRECDALRQGHGLHTNKSAGGGLWQLLSGGRRASKEQQAQQGQGQHRGSSLKQVRAVALRQVVVPPYACSHQRQCSASMWCAAMQA